MKRILSALPFIILAVLLAVSPALADGAGASLTGVIFNAGLLIILLVNMSVKTRKRDSGITRTNQ